RPRSWVTPRGSTRFLRSVPLRGWRRLGQADDLEQCQRIRRRGEAWAQDIVEAHLRSVRSPLDVLGEVHERRTPLQRRLVRKLEIVCRDDADRAVAQQVLDDRA